MEILTELSQEDQLKECKRIMSDGGHPDYIYMNWSAEELTTGIFNSSRVRVLHVTTTKIFQIESITGKNGDYFTIDEMLVDFVKYSDILDDEEYKTKGQITVKK